MVPDIMHSCIHLEIEFLSAVFKTFHAVRLRIVTPLGHVGHNPSQHRQCRPQLSRRLLRRCPLPSTTLCCLSITIIPSSALQSWQNIMASAYYEFYRGSSYVFSRPQWLWVLHFEVCTDSYRLNGSQIQDRNGSDRFFG